MYQYQHVLYRMWLGDSDRQISKAGLMGRTKVSEVRKSAEAKGWLNPFHLMPDEAELQEVFGAPSAIEIFECSLTRSLTRGLRMRFRSSTWGISFDTSSSRIQAAA